MKPSRFRYRASALVSAAFLLAAAGARAGPPYVTDDPEPVDLRHWEVYLSATRLTDEDERTGDAPHVEVNYGAAPELQLHVIIPFSHSQHDGVSTTFGLGDIEVGTKYRFLEETEGRPQIGTFPQLELPTGDASRGLGSGHVRLFLPVWLQKSFGKLQTYGGGGYWINPGEGNRDWWFAGWQAQLQITRFLAPGFEIFYQTPDVEGGSDQAHFNVGFVLDFGEHHHVLFSIGRAFHGCDCSHAYVSYLLTLGPKS